jgi:hypothetical protein
MLGHDQYKYSVTIHSDDLPLVASLRGLAWFSQRTGNKQIAWGGTKGPEWEQNGHRVSFHFSHPNYRENFLKEAARLLPAGWEKVRESDTDPAKPQKSN